MKKKNNANSEMQTDDLMVTSRSARHSPTLFVDHYFQSNVYK